MYGSDFTSIRGLTMNVPQATLEEVLGVYVPGWRYLTRAELQFPDAHGEFSIAKSAYVKDTGHVNAAELVVCYSQLGYAALVESKKQGLLHWPHGQAYPFLGIWQRLMIATMENVKLRRPIDPRSFKGTFQLRRIRKRDDCYFFQTQYDFEKGSATGDILLALPIIQKVRTYQD